MNDFAVRTVGLGKMYRIGGEKEKYRTLRDTITNAARRPIERIRHPGAATHKSEILWALKEVDLDVSHGEAFGIIGRNGAGKSTLLKILSRITEPTEGRVEIRGRVGSLLEVGTGFHPELTGRENIQLNGAILGMTRAEIRSKFDEIVDFSEIGRFLDTPVKRYSSGMYVRLAFAVAAHLDPEILVVDEVLAVGDAAFQKKCLGKMQDVAGYGRTVLFVSHNMPAVSRLCARTMCLDSGSVVDVGPTSEVVGRYLSGSLVHTGENTWDLDEGAPGDEVVRLLGCQSTQGEATTPIVDINQPLTIKLRIAVLKPCRDLMAAISFYAADGTCLTHSCDWGENQLSPGVYSKEMYVPSCVFAEGIVNVFVQLLFYEQRHYCVSLPDALSLETVDLGDSSSVRGRHLGHWVGVMRLHFDWGDYVLESTEVVGRVKDTS